MTSSLTRSEVLVPKDPDWEPVSPNPTEKKKLFQRMWQLFSSIVSKLIEWITSFFKKETKGTGPAVPTHPNYFAPDTPPVLT